MKTITATTILSILVTGTITGAIALNEQQVYAPRDCGGCVEFKKMTHEFEKAVIRAVGNPDTTPADIREMHKVWEDGALRIFLPDPAILRLLEDYQQDVATLMDFYFDGELQQHDVIKQFRQLTHAIATEVLTIAHEGFSDR
ncbi:MAG TPA: hypothetical protein VH415_08285 [Nitrososphaeraceae archaeon]|jgi:hypothetical protein